MATSKKKLLKKLLIFKQNTEESIEDAVAGAKAEYAHIKILEAQFQKHIDAYKTASGLNKKRARQDAIRAKKLSDNGEKLIKLMVKGIKDNKVLLKAADTKIQALQTSESYPTTPEAVAEALLDDSIFEQLSDMTFATEGLWSTLKKITSKAKPKSLDDMEALQTRVQDILAKDAIETKQRAAQMQRLNDIQWHKPEEEQSVEDMMADLGLDMPEEEPGLDDEAQQAEGDADASAEAELQKMYDDLVSGEKNREGEGSKI